MMMIITKRLGRGKLCSAQLSSFQSITRLRSALLQRLLRRLISLIKEAPEDDMLLGKLDELWGSIERYQHADI